MHAISALDVEEIPTIAAFRVSTKPGAAAMNNYAATSATRVGFTP